MPCVQLRVEYITIVVLSRATLRLHLMTKYGMLDLVTSHSGRSVPILLPNIVPDCIIMATK